MTITIQTDFTDSEASGGQTAGSVTMPAEIAAGAQAILLVSHSLDTATVTVSNPGWSTGDKQTFGSQSATVFTKTLDGSEGNVSVNVAFTSGRWAIALAVVQGAGDPQQAKTTTGSSSTDLPIPTLTPSFDDGFCVALVGASLAATSTPHITAPDGWDDDDAGVQTAAYTSNGSGRITAAWIGTLQLATAADVDTPAATATASVAANAGSWLFVFPTESAPAELEVGKTYQLVGGVWV